MVGDRALIGTGSWLLWPIVRIPLGISLMLIDVAMTVPRRFGKTEPMTCPACKGIYPVEKTVSVIKCPHCGTATKRCKGTWTRIAHEGAEPV